MEKVGGFDWFNAQFHFTTKSIMTSAFSTHGGEVKEPKQPMLLFHMSMMLLPGDGAC